MIQTPRSLLFSLPSYIIITYNHLAEKVTLKERKEKKTIKDNEK